LVGVITRRDKGALLALAGEPRAGAGIGRAHQPRVEGIGGNFERPALSAVLERKGLRGDVDQQSHDRRR
jgi:hypothetical protein